MAQRAWTDESLDAMRLMGDEPADQLVQQLFAEHQVDAVNAMMRTLVENDKIPESIPENLRKFLQSVAVLPPWADAKKVRLGENLFWQHGPAIVLILFCYSLPFCYAARKEAHALALTGRLSKAPNRRVTETAQMLIDVMEPGGLLGPGTGVRTAQKVRLMHAGVRFQILSSDEWNKKEFDCPLNQEDLAGTLMSFSVIGLDGLRKLDISVSEAEADAYLHCWNVIGHILGVHKNLLPVDLEDAVAFTEAFRNRQFAESDEGKLMTKALLDMMVHILPGNIFDFIPAAFANFFLEDKTARLLGIPSVPFDKELLRPLQLSNVIAEDLLGSPGGMQKLVEVVSRHLLESLEFVARGGNRLSFSIPKRLWQGSRKDTKTQTSLYLATKKALSFVVKWFQQRLG